MPGFLDVKTPALSGRFLVTECLFMADCGHLIAYPPGTISGVTSTRTKLSSSADLLDVVDVAVIIWSRNEVTREYD